MYYFLIFYFPLKATLPLSITIQYPLVKLPFIILDLSCKVLFSNNGMARRLTFSIHPIGAITFPVDIYGLCQQQVHIDFPLVLMM